MVAPLIVIAGIVGVLALLSYFRGQVLGAAQFLGAGAEVIGQSFQAVLIGLGRGAGEILASPIVGALAGFQAFAQSICGVWPPFVPKPAFCGGGGGASTSGAGSSQMVWIGNAGQPVVLPPAAGVQDRGPTTPINIPPKIPIRGIIA